MRPEFHAKVTRMQKASVVFRGICTGLLVFVALVGVAAVVCVVLGVGGINLGINSPIFQTAGLGLGLRLLLGAVTAAAWAVLFKSVYHLQHLFRIYSRGEIFTRESVGQLRRFGVACVLWGIMSFVWMLSLAISIHPARNVPSHVDSTLVGAVIIVLAWFMDMAVDLREESDLTI